MTRYCLKKDNVDRWYVIPTNQSARFDFDLEVAKNTDSLDAFYSLYRNRLVDGPESLSFTDIARL